MIVFLHPSQMAHADLVRQFSSDPNMNIVEVKELLTMGEDELVDAVTRSTARTLMAQGQNIKVNVNSWYVNQIRSVVGALIERMRAFGYSDETIHAILVDEKAKP